MIRRNTKLAARALSLTLAGTLVAGAEVWGQERGWLGISVSCECTTEETAEAFIWHFGSEPIVTDVLEGGPGDEAGLRAGDTILSVNGVDITTDEGGRLFGALRVGQGAELRVRRVTGTTMLTIVPRPREAVYGKLRVVPAWDEGRDSLVKEVRELYDRQLRWQIAVREAENALRRSEAEGRQVSGGEASLQQQRAQIDSMNRAIGWLQGRLRELTDSLAARTLVLVPVEESAERIEARTIRVYPDAVAGARFKELDEGSPFTTILPGVKEGLLITEVAEKTPAHTAGLREGDVVMAVNGEPVRTIIELRRLLRSSTEAELTYVRQGKQQKCTIPSKK